MPPGKTTFAEPPAVAEPNRYAHMVPEETLEKWRSTFVFFDRDGGGSVDLKELGTMFRKLGLTPSDEEMRAMVHAVDDDQHSHPKYTVTRNTLRSHRSVKIIGPATGAVQNPAMSRQILHDSFLRLLASFFAPCARLISFTMASEELERRGTTAR